jgi:hypothetical protein
LTHPRTSWGRSCGIEIRVAEAVVASSVVARILTRMIRAVEIRSSDLDSMQDC